MAEGGNMKQPDKVEFLGGQVSALMAFVAASIQSHPDPDRLYASPSGGWPAG